MADTNTSDVPEIWSPELWHSDSKTGKMKKRRLPVEDKPSEEETRTILTESEEPIYSAPAGTLLPVEEEEDEIEEDS